jgi:hypothetical protein
VEKTFGVYIPDSDLTVDNADTLEKMATCVVRFSHKELP